MLKIHEEMEDAHKKSITIGDIKLENIMFNELEEGIKFVDIETFKCVFSYVHPIELYVNCENKKTNNNFISNCSVCKKIRNLDKNELEFFKVKDNFYYAINIYRVAYFYLKNYLKSKVDDLYDD